jgi:hypothetical protein
LIGKIKSSASHKSEVMGIPRYDTDTPSPEWNQSLKLTAINDEGIINFISE